jgi:PBP1b-binding outer membrane lipoprotein LpoB
LNLETVTEESTMYRYLAVAVSLVLSGCGVEVAGTAAVSAVGKAQEAKQAQQDLERIQQKLDAAAQSGQQRLTDAEKAVGQQ